jgi:tyrosine-protein kinase Etk/Wzc
MEQNSNFAEEEIQLKDYLIIVLNYKWLILSVFLLISIATAIYTFRLPKIYEASSMVMIEKKSSSDMFMLGGSIGPTTLNNTKEIIKSRPISEIVFKMLKRNKDYKNFPIRESKDPIHFLMDGIKVDSKRETDILTLKFDSTNPEEAKFIVNAFAKAIVQKKTEYARVELSNIRQFLEDQVSTIKRRLQNSEEDLRTYKVEHGISILSEETRNLIEKSSDMEANLKAAETEYQVAEKKYIYLKNELSKQDSLLGDVNSILNSPLLEKLRSEVVDTQTRLSKLLTKQNYTESHPEIISLTKELERAKKNLKKEIVKNVAVKTGSADPLVYRSELIKDIAVTETDVTVSKAKYISLKEAVKDYQDKINLLPDTELDLARRQRAFQMNEKIYGMMVEKYEDAKIAEQGKMGNIRIIEEAITPEKPIKPNKKMNILIGLVLGMGFGLGLAFLIHSLDNRIHTLDDVEKNINYPVVGTIPKIEIDEEEYKKRLEKINSQEDEIKLMESEESARLISHYAPKSPIAEAYRTLRTNIISRRRTENAISIMVTSPGPQEGKSTTISNIAITLAQTGSKVILIDADLRKPVLHDNFNLKKEIGLSDFYDENSKYQLNDLIKKSAVKNLSIITSGYVPPNPSEMLASKKTEELISKLKEKFEFVVFDTPPIIAVTDAMILAKKVEQKFFVVRVDKTERGVIKRALEMMENVNVNVDGVIVNGVDVKKYYRGYSYYYYYYYYYYGKDENKKKKRH